MCLFMDVALAAYVSISEIAEICAQHFRSSTVGSESLARIILSVVTSDDSTCAVMAWDVSSDKDCIGGDPSRLLDYAQLIETSIVYRQPWSIVFQTMQTTLPATTV